MGRSKAPTVELQKTTSQNVQLHVQVNQQKTKQNGKNKKEVSNHLVHCVLRTHTCIQPQCVRIPLGTWLFRPQTRQGMFIEPSCYTASYLLVPLSFQPHCKSLLSLERQILPCLQRSSMAGNSFWVPESKSFGFFLKFSSCPSNFGSKAKFSASTVESIAESWWRELPLQLGTRWDVIGDLNRAII